MSRAYLIRVSESITQVIHADDHVKTQLQILDILPPEEMASLLEDELKNRGYEENDGKLVKVEDDIVIEVDPATAEVKVSISADDEVDLVSEREANAWDDYGPSSATVRNTLTDEAQADLGQQAEKLRQQLQKEITDKLEQSLADVREELDVSVNRVTAQALKQKAKSMGKIKELSEDVEKGEMTIVLEV